MARGAYRNPCTSLLDLLPAGREPVPSKFPMDLIQISYPSGPVKEIRGCQRVQTEAGVYFSSTGLAQHA